jgi:hypothetical protein
MWHPLSTKVGTTSPTSGGCSVGIVRSRTKATEFCFSWLRKTGITFAVSLLWVHSVCFKANKIPFLMTYYTNIISTVMLSRSSNLTFGPVFLKMWNFNFFKILCACNYYLKHMEKVGWGWNLIGFYQGLYCEQSLHLKQHVSFKFFTFINLG